MFLLLLLMLLLLLCICVPIRRRCVDCCAEAACDLCVDCSQQPNGSRNIQLATVTAQKLLVSLMQPAVAGSSNNK